ncbi:MAG: hypothetical protein CWE10_04085 [Symbiobacterium thermophilum]|uniref:Uncharacterized protein n=1 Tax=Symbiobacterium thermophilum TaxID=2734 RepID=A0A953I6Y6_SYMTR|nr:hypothetical protein [Symbiobacterium thermophilum]
MKPDIFDGAALLGLFLIFAGLWWLSPPWALMITGAVLVAFGIWGSRTATRTRPAGKAGDEG